MIGVREGAGPKILIPFWAYSSVGLEHSPDKGKVSGSNPLRPTTSDYDVWSFGSGGCSSIGRALPLQGRGWRFDPAHLHHFKSA